METRSSLNMNSGWNFHPERPFDLELMSRRGIVGSVNASLAGPSPAAAGITGPVTARVRALLPSLSRTGRRIGEAVLDDPGGIVELTVSDLAARTGTSVASVVRFCQDLGLRGFGDLKLRLASESAPSPTGGPELEEATTPTGVLAAVLRSSADALAHAADSVDPGAFGRAVDAVGAAEHLLVVGVGTSAPLAQDAAYRLRGIGLLAEAPADAHVQHVSAALLGPRAVCLAISHTGQTRETLAAVGAAREAGAATVAVTSFYRSPLTELCDHALVAGSPETHHQIEARASRLVHSALLDALHAAVALAHPERSQAAQQRAAHTIADHRI
jgi:DNA-binding MurR/RpiR family transcriptional regulator